MNALVKSDVCVAKSESEAQSLSALNINLINCETWTELWTAPHRETEQGGVWSGQGVVRAIIALFAVCMSNLVHR